MNQKINDDIEYAKKIKRLFSTPDGQEVYKYLLHQFGADRWAFVPTPDGKYDPLQAALNDGIRRAAMFLKERVEHTDSFIARKNTLKNNQVN